jgi:monovalent cation:H+ antiporter-2, CPA2 family
MGAKLDIVPPEARDLVVAGAMISILANPLLFHLLDQREARKAAADVAAAAAAANAPDDAEPKVTPDDPAAVSEARPSAQPPAA